MTAGSIQPMGTGSFGGSLESRGGRSKDNGVSHDYYNLPSLFKKAEALGFEFKYYPEVPSTMTIVDDLAAQDSGPVVVLTDHQTAGVGRTGRSWYDKSESSVLMSVLLKMRDEDVEQTRILGDMIALQTALALSQLSGQDFQIQYPNDITFNGAKACGILVKNIFMGTEYVGTNVGIGVNVHYKDADFDGVKTDYPPTSLDATNGKFNKREDVVSALMAVTRYSASNTLAAFINLADQDRYDNLWKMKSSALNKKIAVFSGESEDPILEGKVVDTKMGKGILLEGQEEWHDLFNTNMRVKIN